jgi:uncharacterized protein YjeT (DUF2065 family)
MGRISSMLGLAAVADGATAVLVPEKVLTRWSAGPEWYRQAMEPFAKNPEATRAIGLTEVVVGMLLLRRGRRRRKAAKAAKAG